MDSSFVKVFFLMNPSRQKEQWDFREAAGQAARRHGCTARFGQVERLRPDSTDILLRQAWEEGCRRIVVIGGDGTLHHAVNGLAKQKRLGSVELGLVPGGTCNDFARAIGFSSRRLDEAFQAALTGDAKTTDVGQLTVSGVGDVLFLNNAGFGRRPADSEARARRSTGADARSPRSGPLTKRAAKPLRTLQRFQSVPLRVQWEKGSIEGDFFMGMACNGPFFSGGLYFSKGVRANDGLLDLYLLPRMPKWKLLPMLMMGRLGRPVRSPHLITLRVGNLDVEAQQDLWPQADGEPPPRAVRKIAFGIAKEKAQILAPRASRICLLWNS